MKMLPDDQTATDSSVLSFFLHQSEFRFRRPLAFRSFDRTPLAACRSSTSLHSGEKIAGMLVIETGVLTGSRFCVSALFCPVMLASSHPHSVMPASRTPPSRATVSPCFKRSFIMDGMEGEMVRRRGSRMGKQAKRGEKEGKVKHLMADSLPSLCRLCYFASLSPSTDIFARLTADLSFIAPKLPLSSAQIDGKMDLYIFCCSFSSPSPPPPPDLPAKKKKLHSASFVSSFFPRVYHSISSLYLSFSYQVIEENGTDSFFSDCRSYSSLVSSGPDTWMFTRSCIRMDVVVVVFVSLAHRADVSFTLHSDISFRLGNEMITERCLDIARESNQKVHSASEGPSGCETIRALLLLIFNVDEL